MFSAALPALAMLVIALIQQHENGNGNGATPPKPKPKPKQLPKRSPHAAAEDLAAYLARSKNFGSKVDRPQEIREAQRDLGVIVDGIVGPITRAAAKAQGIDLPLKPFVRNDPTIDELVDQLPLLDDSEIVATTRPPAAPSKPPRSGRTIPDPFDPKSRAVPDPFRAPAGEPKPVATIETIHEPTKPAPSKVRAPSAPKQTPKRSPHDAATALKAFIERTRNFGSATDRPQEIRDAQRDLGVTADGIAGPKTRTAAQAAGVTLPPRTAEPVTPRDDDDDGVDRSPHDAALALKTYLEQTGNFGSASDRPQEIRDAQSDLGLVADGIAGPKTRAAALAAGVTLPAPKVISASKAKPKKAK